MKSNVIIQGDIGTGKTRSLITLLPTYIDERGKEHEGVGLERVGVISMEPGGEATLGRNLCGAPNAHSHVIHQKFIPAVDVPWETLAQYVELANRLPLKTLLETTDPQKNRYRQFVELYSTCADYVCDHCGESFGHIDGWTDKMAIGIDALTGLTRAAIQNLVGGKPIRSLPEIGTIMEFIESFLDKFWSSTKCSAILLAHIDREQSPLTGMSTLTIHTIGQKLAPKIVKKPDEVITSYVADGTYLWSTEPTGTEVQKRRRLPLSSRIPADFREVFNERA